jgi:hypothetical protein
MFTSNFARVKRLPPELEPVSIAVGNRYFKGRLEPRLAPTRPMLKMGREDFDRHYEEILATLNAQEIYESLGDNAVLLCWESPNIYCHRRRVAEWLEASLGIVVPEFGFERAEILPYAELPEKKAKATAT